MTKVTGQEVTTCVSLVAKKECGHGIVPSSVILGKGTGGDLGFWPFPAPWHLQERKEVRQLAYLATASPCQHSVWVWSYKTCRGN